MLFHKIFFLPTLTSRSHIIDNLGKDQCLELECNTDLKNVGTLSTHNIFKRESYGPISIYLKN